MLVRWLLIAALAVLSSSSVNASEQITDEAAVPIEFATPVSDIGVIVTPIPIPEAVIEILKPANQSVKLRSAKTLKVAKKKSFPKTLLSRSERQQMALLNTGPKNNRQAVHNHLHDENGESGYDELALHQFYNRPKINAESDDDADAAELSDAVKLRLLLARAKAVEALVLAQVEDQGDDLPEGIKLRLLMARLKAVKAHEEKFF
jgi:hypothetical protein